MKTDTQNANSAQPLLIGLQAARANFTPGLIVQIAMVIVLVAYYFYEPARAWMAQLAELKARWGYGFAFVSSAIAGGILPELLTIAVFQKCRVRRENFENLIFGICFWGLQGTIVDCLYRFQAGIFGAHASFVVVAKKVFVDQFIFNPFFAAPWTLAAYQWKNQKYQFSGMTQVLTGRFYKERTVPTLIATWGVWIPLVSMVYALPSLLQIPLFSLALTFWVILLTWMTRRHSS